jgi:hypothetical protein
LPEGAFYGSGGEEPPPPGTVSIAESGGAEDWRTGNRVVRRQHLYDVIPYPSVEDYAPTTGAQRVTECGFVIPYWQVALALLVPAGCAAARRAVCRWRATRAARHNLCPVCAYDLRASPDRCPECGVRITPTQTATANATTIPASTGHRADGA